MLKTLPSVHFILPAYKSSKTIAACLTSIQKQVYPSDKIRTSVVENGPAQGIESLVASFPNTTYYFNPTTGRSEARNYLLKTTGEEFIAYIDVDVVLDPEWLVYCMESVSSPYISAVTGPVIKEGSGWLDLFRKEVSSASTNGQCNILENPYVLGGINTAAVLFRTSALKKVQGFDCSLKRSEDYELTHRMLRNGYIVATNAHAKAQVYWDRGVLEYFISRYFQMGYYTPKIHLLHEINLQSGWSSMPVIGIKGIFRKGKKHIGLGLMLINFFFFLGYQVGRLRFFNVTKFNIPSSTKKVLIEQKGKAAVYLINPHFEFLIIRNNVRFYSRKLSRIFIVDEKFQRLLTKILSSFEISIADGDEDNLLRILEKDKILIPVGAAKK